MGQTIRDLPAHERPREKLIAKGVENLMCARTPNNREKALKLAIFHDYSQNPIDTSFQI